MNRRSHGSVPESLARDKLCDGKRMSAFEGDAIKATTHIPPLQRDQQQREYRAVSLSSLILSSYDVYDRLGELGPLVLLLLLGAHPVHEQRSDLRRELGLPLLHECVHLRLGSLLRAPM